MGFKFNHLRQAMLAAGVIPSILPLVITNRELIGDTGVAPFAVQFDASGTSASSLTARPFHDLHHSWNFGDEDVSTWGYGTQAGVAKKNRASGPIAAHVYETPGTYTVTYTVTDPITRQFATRTRTITVTDPDTVFAGTNTICVANGTVPIIGDCPAGADRQNVTTWAGVVALMATGKRILLKRGDTWTVPSTTATNVAGPGIVGAYGTGAKPIIQLTATGSKAFSGTSASSFADWRIMDLDCNASGLATGAARNACRFWDMGQGTGSTSGYYGLLLRCSSASSGSFAYVNNHTVVADCVVTSVDGGSGNIGIWTGPADYVAVLGTSVADASAAEHCFRFQGLRYGVISHCYGNNPASTKHAFTLRAYATAGAFNGTYSEKVVISNNEFASPHTQCVMIHPQNTSNDERFRDIVFERNYINATAMGVYGIGMGVKGGERISIRNNIFRLASQPTGLHLDVGSSLASNGNVPPIIDGGYVYNNTFYSSVAGTQATQAVQMASASHLNVSVTNNIYYAPLHTNTKYMVNNVVGAVMTIATNTTDGTGVTTNPNFTATPPVTYADWKPTSGYAVNGGTTVPVFDDFFGVERVYPTADIGAVSP